jgi:hypothetical protein
MLQVSLCEERRLPRRSLSTPSQFLASKKDSQQYITPTLVSMRIREKTGTANYRAITDLLNSDI